MKTKKTVIIFILIFVILGALYFFISGYSPKENEPSKTNMPGILLREAALPARPGTVLEVEIENPTEHFTLVKTENGFSVSGKENIALNENNVYSLFSAAGAFYADSVIEENASDLAPYGLSAPQATAKIRTDVGEYTLLFGDRTPAQDGYYLTYSGSRTVYKAPGALCEMFLSPLAAFRVLALTAFDPASVRSVFIERGESILSLSYTAPPEGASAVAAVTWHIDTPISRDADAKAVTTLILQPASSLMALDVASDDPSELSAYGFSGDRAVFITETETLSFAVGTAGNAAYLMKDGENTVYRLNAGDLSFMDVTPFDVLEKMTNLYSLDDLSAIEFSYADTKIRFDIAHDGEDVSFTVNGNAADAKSCKDIYMEIAALSVDGMVEKNAPTGGEPAATLTYTKTDGSTISIGYLPYDDLNYAVSENGSCTFFIRKTKLSALSDKLSAFLNQQES